MFFVQSTHSRFIATWATEARRLCGGRWQDAPQGRIPAFEQGGGGVSCLRNHWPTRSDKEDDCLNKKYGDQHKARNHKIPEETGHSYALA